MTHHSNSAADLTAEAIEGFADNLDIEASAKTGKEENLATPPPSGNSGVNESRNGKTRSTSPLAPPAAPISFRPEGIHYLAANGSFLVDVGTRFRRYSKKSPVANGLRRHFRNTGNNAEDAEALTAHNLEACEIDRAVDWAGSIAGHRRGIHRRHGQALLVLDEPEIPDPVPGETPVLSDILAQAFPVQDALRVYLGWLKGGVAAIRAGIHQPAPMLVLAGEANAGKSLLAWITAQCFGGRIGHPWTAWSGNLPWNDDLVRAELLLIDDNQSSTDIRHRKAFGAKFKEAIHGPEIQVNQRNTSSLSLRPVWRVLVCCNETPENLSVIPPIDSDIADKIALLHFQKITTPVDTSTVEGRGKLQALIRAELPAFLARLEAFTVPRHLGDSRAGVTAWKSPHLTAQLRDIAPEGRMENLLLHALEAGFLGVDRGEEKWMRAHDVQAGLTATDSPTSAPARSLLGHDTSAGRYLSQLAGSDCPLVADKKTVNGLARYLIRRPEGGEVE